MAQLKILELYRESGKIISLGEDAPIEANGQLVLANPNKTNELFQAIMYALSKVATVIAAKRGLLAKIRIAVIGVQLIYDIIKIYRKK